MRDLVKMGVAAVTLLVGLPVGIIVVIALGPPAWIAAGALTAGATVLAVVRARTRSRSL